MQYRETLCFGDFLIGSEQKGGRNVEGNTHSDEVPNGNEEEGISSWKKEHPFHKMAKNLAKSYVCILELCGR